MITGLTIREERPEDIPVIYSLIKRAFLTQPHADGDEQDLVNLLRARGELTLSRVAVLAGQGVVGHIGFNPVTVAGTNCGWFQLSPVSVEPALHRQGIGAALIRDGLARLRALGARGVGVVGNPAYYERFGFTVISGLAPEGGEAQYFRAIAWDQPAPAGTVRYACAFY